MITNNNICVCTTAIPRPDIHEITYSSFSKNIKGINIKNLNLYLNIDMSIDGDTNKCIKIAQKYFNIVVVNICYSPNFSNAVKWCWKNAQTDYILHLEDDWELLTKVDIKDINNSLLKNEELSQVVIRAWNVRSGGFSLSPSFIKKKAYKTLSEILTPDENPEEKIRMIRLRERDNNIRKLVDINTAIEIIPHEQEDVILKDLGRKWMAENNLSRTKINFISHTKGEQKDFLRDQNKHIKEKYLNDNSQ